MIGKFKNYEKNIEYVKNKNKDYEIQIQEMKEKR